MTTPISQSKGIPPHRYTPYLESVMAREAAWRRRRKAGRIGRRVLIVAALIVLALYVGGVL